MIPSDMPDILFLVQQSIEKALKALICFAGRPIPLTHDLLFLEDRLDDKSKIPGNYDLGQLNDFAAIRRYERGFFDLDDSDIAAVIKVGEQIHQHAKDIIQPN